MIQNKEFLHNKKTLLWTRKITDSKKKNIEKIPTVTTSDEWLIKFKKK